MRAESLDTLELQLRAAAARPSTIATYLRIATSFATTIAPRSVAEAVRDDVERYLARPRATGAPVAPSTRNLEVVALRALFRSQGGADPTTGMALKRAERREPAVPGLGELRALFAAAASGSRPTRDLAMIGVLFQAGLRVHELAQLRVDQVDLHERVLVGVEGKNGTRVDLPLGPEVATLLAAWCGELGTDRGPLFPGADPTRQISIRSIQRLVVRLRNRAGISKPITPHSLRHATATQAIARGVDLPTTAALMRHSRVETTMRYVSLASNARRAAATRIGEAIPRDVLPDLGRGDPAAVDAEDELCDVADCSERGDPASEQSLPPTTKRASERARFESEAVSPCPDVPGGDHDRSWMRRALEDHLFRAGRAITLELDRVLARRCDCTRNHGLSRELDGAQRRRPERRLARRRGACRCGASRLHE